MSEEPNPPPEPEELIIRPPRLRRQLLMGAGATASLILTLANRPAFAAKTCNHSTWISWKGEMAHTSMEPSPCTGDSVATWSTNAASLWAPSWGNSYTTTTGFTSTFAIIANGWTRKSGTDTFAGALAGTLIFQHTPPSTNTISGNFPAQAVAALLNCNFYGDKYGTATNAQTTAALISAVVAVLNTTSYTTGNSNANAFITKYSALNTA